MLADGLKKETSEGKDGTRCRVGLSPLGVVWTFSSLCYCLSGGVFRDVLLRKEHMKLISELISDVHLNALRNWKGLGGRSSGVADLINAVVDLLAFPFIAVQSSPNMPSASASISSGFLLNVGSPGGRMGAENKEMVKVIEANMHQYIQAILEDFYEPIYRAGLLDYLKDFLSNNDADLRSKACSAIGNMCRHSPYFYSSLIAKAAYHNDVLYEQLRRSIPQFTKRLHSAEEDKTKANAAGALSNLVSNSDILCEDIISQGAMEALLKLVGDYSVVALSPSWGNAVTESPIKIVLFALRKMFKHALCRHSLSALLNSFPFLLS